MDIYAAIRVGLLILNVILVIWVVQDAKRRESHPVVWGIVTLLLGVIGWIAYLCARPALQEAPSVSTRTIGVHDKSDHTENRDSASRRHKRQIRPGFQHGGGPSVVPDDIFD